MFGRNFYSANKKAKDRMLDESIRFVDGVGRSYGMDARKLADLIKQRGVQAVGDRITKGFIQELTDPWGVLDWSVWVTDGCAVFQSTRTPEQRVVCINAPFSARKDWLSVLYQADADAMRTTILLMTPHGHHQDEHSASYARDLAKRIAERRKGVV